MFDGSLLFDGTISAAGAVTGTAITVTRASTNVIDLVAARDVGVGDMLELHVVVTETFTSASTDVAATITNISLQTSATAGGTYVDVLASPTYTLATMVAGAGLFRYKLPILNQLNATTVREFIRLYYTVGATMTAGKVAAWVTAAGDRQAYFSYARNYTVAA